MIYIYIYIYIYFISCLVLLKILICLRSHGIGEVFFWYQYFLLPILSKVYQKCLYKQIENYMENIFSSFQCSFRRGFNHLRHDRKSQGCNGEWWISYCFTDWPIKSVWLYTSSFYYSKARCLVLKMILFV